MENTEKREVKRRRLGPGFGGTQIMDFEEGGSRNVFRPKHIA